MNRISIALAMASLALVSSLDAATYAQWSFGEAAGTGLTATANTGSVTGTWSTNLTTGGGALANGSGSMAFRTQGLFSANSTSWVPTAPVVSSGIVFITVKFSQFTLNASQAIDGELFCLATRNTGGFAQAEIYLRRNTVTNALEVKGRASNTATGSTYVEGEYVQLVPTYTAPSGLIITMAVDYTNRTYGISAKVGNETWRENICSGTIYSGAVFSGLRLQLGNNFNSASDNVLVDEITISSVHPGRDAGSSAGTISGSLSVGGSIDSLGNEITFGTGSGLYGAGFFYDPADGSLIFDLSANSTTPASWIWQYGDGVAMTLGPQNRLMLGQPGGDIGILLDPGFGAISIIPNLETDSLHLTGGSGDLIINASGLTRSGQNGVALPFALNVSELTGSAVSATSSPNKILKLGIDGKIDPSVLNLTSSSLIGSSVNGVSIQGGPLGGGISLTTVGLGNVVINSAVSVGSPALAVNGGVFIASELDTDGYNAGALVVAGGVGIGGGLVVQNSIYAAHGVFAGLLGPVDNEPVIDLVAKRLNDGDGNTKIDWSSDYVRIYLDSQQSGVAAFSVFDGGGDMPVKVFGVDQDGNTSGTAVTIVSKANALIKTTSGGKIDPSLLPAVIRVAPAGDLSMGNFTNQPISGP